MSSKSFLHADQTLGLSRAITKERLKRSGLVASSTSEDADLEAFREVARQVVNSKKSKAIGATTQVLRKLAGA